MTYILAEQTARCAPDTAPAKLQSYFAGFERSGNAIRYEIKTPIDEVKIPFAADAREVRLHIGQPKQRDLDVLLPLTWEPNDNRLLPAFEGQIEITPLSSDEVQLSVIGEYDPPLGIIGEAFDAAIGRRIADATIALFARELKTAVERAA